MFLIDVRLNKCVIKKIPEDSGTLESVPDYYRT